MAVAGARKRSAAHTTSRASVPRSAESDAKTTSAKPPRFQKRGNVKREDVLREGRRLFAEKGYEGLTMGELAERAGLRKATLFHYFPSKESLYARVLEELLEAIEGVLARVFASSENLEKQLDLVIESLAEVLGKQPDVARLLIREVLYETESTHSPLNKKIDMVLGIARDLVVRGQREGVFDRDLDPTHIVITFVGLQLMPFAMGSVMDRFAGMRPSHPAFISGRTVAVREQLRKLLLASRGKPR